MGLQRHLYTHVFCGVLTTHWTSVVSRNAPTVWPEGRPHPPPSRPASDHIKPNADQDCIVRMLAYEYALFLQPVLSPLREVFDALELNTKCGKPTPPFQSRRYAAYHLPEKALYVDAEWGSDDASGNISHPLRSVAHAVDLAANGSTIVLRSGVHFLNSTLHIKKSGLVVQNYPNEEVWMSGGTPLDGVVWQKHRTLPSGSLWRADLSGKLPKGVGVLGLNKHLGQRMTRARHPNRDPSTGTMERSWLQGRGGPHNVTWIKPSPWDSSVAATTIWQTAPDDEQHHAGMCGTHFTWGLGGPCSRYSNGGAYTCSANASGGGYGWEQMVKGAPLFPVGLDFMASLFESGGVPPPANWTKSTRTGEKPIVQTWTNGWCTTFWEVEAVESTVQSGHSSLHFGRGGQQTGRGFHIDNLDPKGALNTEGGWRIENVLELLDAPEEWFFDRSNQLLYFYFNGTGSPDQTRWVVPSLDTLLRIVGTEEAPLSNITLRGIGFRDSHYQYMMEWGVPSGGDWALHRGGAVFIEAAEGITIEQCQFEMLDGNAVFLSKYTRNVRVANSSFAYIGDNAMAAWGETARGKNGDERLPDGEGIDGTGGAQPRGSIIEGNIVREIGINERQSSAWGEFKACQSQVSGNIFFNMPRAAININDGFGGGTVIESNLLFNTCRESGDHGPFNSWDRIPFLTDVRDGTPSLIPANNTIARNFIVSNYGAGFGVDNDDTSSYYDIVSNFFYLGGGIKCDYDGHSKVFHENVLLAQSGGAACHHTCAYAKGFTDYCYNNRIVQAPPRDPSHKTEPFALIWFCDKDNVSHILPDYNNEMLPIIHSNQIYNVEAAATVTCGYSGNPAPLPVSVFNKAGLMLNTTANPLPPDEIVLSWARAALGMPPKEVPTYV